MSNRKRGAAGRRTVHRTVTRRTVSTVVTETITIAWTEGAEEPTITIVETKQVPPSPPELPELPPDTLPPAADSEPAA